MARVYFQHVGDRRIEAESETRLDELVRQARVALEREVVDLRRTRELLLDEAKNARAERDTARARVVELEAELARLRAAHNQPRTRGAIPE